MAGEEKGKAEADPRKFLGLVGGAYLLTITTAVLIIVVAILSLSGTHSCKTMGNALVALWVMIAALFLTSLIAVVATARKRFPGITTKKATVVVYGLALLLSYIVLACGLMVAFNC